MYVTTFMGQLNSKWLPKQIHHNKHVIDYKSMNFINNEL